MRIDITDVKAALRTRDVLEFYGWTFKKSGDEFESTACPSRSDHSRRALLINANSGRWRCFPCGTSGDLFHFIAEAERISDFPSVLAKAAEIAGVGPSPLSADERRARHEEWKRRALEEEERERREKLARDQAAIGIAARHWEQLSLNDERGRRYLASRHVDEVLEIDSCVRFDADGSPSIPLYNSKGEIHNVVSRRLPELGEPKTPGLYRCPSAGTLAHAVTDIESGRDVVLTEGVFDTLTARLAWHSAVILGAHAADNMPKVAQVAAPIIASKRCRLLVVAHRDAHGFRTAKAACEIAIGAGLSITRGSLAIANHPEKDINDAWTAGWRP